MTYQGLKSAIVATVLLSHVGQAQAQDGGRILLDILGTGAGIFLNEMNRERRQRPQYQDRQRDDARAGELSADQIYAAQVRLNELGYDTGIPDGRYGPRTREAIRRYQNDNRMVATGVLTRKEFAVLTRSPSGAPSTDADDEPLDTREMTELQMALQSMGFDIGTADGKAGRKTGAAISRFLGARGLDPYQVPIREAQRLILTAAGVNPQVAGSEGGIVPARRSASAYGLPMRDGAILLATTTNHALRTRIGGGNADNYDKNLDRFGRLLILSGAPGFLDDPQKTHFFLPLVKLEELTPFVDKNALALTAQYGNAHLTRWRGDNQFAREDSRKAFLSAYREKLIAEAPNLPLRIDIVRSVRFGAYDGTSLALDGDSHSVFPHYSEVGLEAVEPFGHPDKWVLNQAEARRIVEAQSRVVAGESYDGPVTVTRAEITAIRPTDKGIILDIAAIDITAYESAALLRPLGQLPLPPNAVVKESGQPDVASNAAVPFDPIFVRMLAAKEQPDFAAKSAFHLETFRMRREAEKRDRETDRRTSVDWPRMIPASLLATNQTPAATDVSALTRWFESTRSKVGNHAQLHGFCRSFTEKADRCVLPAYARQADGTLALKRLVEGSVELWKYAWNGLPDGADSAVKRAYPNAAGYISFGAGSDIPGMIVLTSHPAWFSVPVPFKQISDAALDVTVVSHKILGTPSGKGIIAVEIAPTSLRYLADRRWQKLDIAPVDENTASSEGIMDVLGVKVGMPLDTAQSIIAKHFEGRGTGALETRKRTSLPDPIFGESFTFKMPHQYRLNEISFSSAPIGEEAIRLFFDNAKAEKPIVAINRSVKFAENANDNNTNRVLARPVLDGLLTKYGAPDKLGDIGDLYDYSMWAVRPTAKARIKSGDEFCELNSWLSTIDSDGSPYHSDLVENDCGELLSVWFKAGVVSQVLIDTSAVLKLRQKYAAEARAREAAERAARPPVKF